MDELNEVLPFLDRHGHTVVETSHSCQYLWCYFHVSANQTLTFCRSELPFICDCQYLTEQETHQRNTNRKSHCVFEYTGMQGLCRVRTTCSSLHCVLHSRFLFLILVHRICTEPHSSYPSAKTACMMYWMLQFE